MFLPPCVVSEPSEGQILKVRLASRFPAIKLIENDFNFGAWGFIGLDLKIIHDIDCDQSLRCKVLHEPKVRERKAGEVATHDNPTRINPLR